MKKVEEYLKKNTQIWKEDILNAEEKLLKNKRILSVHCFLCASIFESGSCDRRKHRFTFVRIHAFPGFNIKS